jgi:hypothetical protein
VPQLLAKCHNECNLAEYEGRTEVDDKLLAALSECTTKLEKAVLALDPPPPAAKPKWRAGPTADRETPA